jgi:hypothetical protein
MVLAMPFYRLISMGFFCMMGDITLAVSGETVSENKLCLALKY